MSKLFAIKKGYFALLILIALLGSIFFFPLNLGGKYTCFYHRIFAHSQPVSEKKILENHKYGNIILFNSDDQSLSESENNQDHPETSHHDSALLDTYIHQYALLWWSSIGLFILGVYLLSKLTGSVKGNDSGLTFK